MFFYKTNKNNFQKRKNEQNFAKCAPLYPAFNSYSLNFTATPVYLVEKSGEHKYRKFSGRNEAARELDCHNSAISRAVCTNTPIYGYYVIDAQDIEDRDKNGNVCVNKAKLLNKIYLNTLKSALYAIDIQNGGYQRFINQSEASRALNIKETNISNCIVGKSSHSKNYVFVKASDVEKPDKEGYVNLDKEKLVKILNSSLEASSVIYAISPDGSYKKYSNSKQAAKEIGVSLPYVSNCKNYGIAVKMQRLVRAKEVEYFDDNICPVVDEDKIRSLIL